MVDTNELDFSAMLEDFEQSPKKVLQPGNRVQATIISIGEKTVFVDTGSDVDGIVDRESLLNEEKQLAYNIGDVLELYVISVSDKFIQLAFGMKNNHIDVDMFQNAFMGRIPVEGKVVQPCNGGFQIEIMKTRAFCPISQIDIKYVENPQNYVGATYQFLIIKLENGGRNIVVSRRALLEKEASVHEQEFFENNKIDSVVPGIITRIEPYGVFVEMTPTISGMVHISELSWSRVSNPKEVVEIGQKVNVKILRIEKTEKSRKIALSIKQITDQPWLTIDRSIFKIGEKFSGKVLKLMDFGAFVEIAPGITGLVHISEFSYTKRILKPEDVVSAGDIIMVQIKEIDWDKNRISLSVRDAEGGDPWITVSNTYKLGMVLSGTVEKESSLGGFFIQLILGVTGLITADRLQSLFEVSPKKLKEGDVLEVQIIAIDLEKRRIELALPDENCGTDWKDSLQPSFSNTIGSLADKLQNAIEQKDK